MLHGSFDRGYYSAVWHRYGSFEVMGAYELDGRENRHLSVSVNVQCRGEEGKPTVAGIGLIEDLINSLSEKKMKLPKAILVEYGQSPT
jgi:hypothetical protein